MNYSVAVTIANWNGLDMLDVCLRSLQHQTVQPSHIIIVDNGSTDGSVELLQRAQSQQTNLELILLTTNCGFAAAHNLAIEAAFVDPTVTHVLTLNNDTELTPTFIEEMLKPFTEQKDLASVQGKIVRINDTSVIDCTGVLIHRDMSGFNRGQNQTDNGQFDQAQEIMGPSASAAVYSRAGLETIRFAEKLTTQQSWKTRDGKIVSATYEYFDNQYFAYYEDVDLLWRLRLAGFTSWYTPTAIAHHAHSATGVVASPFKAFHIHRNHYYNIIKDTPLPFLLWTILLIPLRYILLIVSVVRGKGAAARLSNNTKTGTDAAVAQSTVEKKLAAGGAKQMILIVFRAWKDVIINLPMLLAKRRHIQRSRTVSRTKINNWFDNYRVSWRQTMFE